MLDLYFRRSILAICVWTIVFSQSIGATSIKRLIKTNQPSQQNRTNWIGYRISGRKSNDSIAHNRLMFGHKWSNKKSQSAKSVIELPYFVNPASDKKSKAKKMPQNLPKVHDRSIDLSTSLMAIASKRQKSNLWIMNSSTSFAIIIAACLAFIVALFVAIYLQQQQEDVQQQQQMQLLKSDDKDLHRKRRRAKRENESNKLHAFEAKKLLRTRLYVVKRYIPCHFDVGLPCPEKPAKSNKDYNYNSQNENSTHTSSLYSISVSVPVSVVNVSAQKQ